MPDEHQATEREDAYGRVGVPQQCMACDGVGKTDDDTCGTCGGEGFVCWWGAVSNQEKERAQHAHSFMRDLERLPYQWRGMKPEVVCAGSPAQVLFCVRDAQKDIVATLAEIDRLRALLRSDEPSDESAFERGKAWQASVDVAEIIRRETAAFAAGAEAMREVAAELVAINVINFNAGKLMPVDPTLAKFPDVTRRAYSAAIRALPLPTMMGGKLCEDCPPIGYPTDKTRCCDCPRKERT